MAQNLKTIQIPAEVQLSVKDQAKAMRTIADNLNNIFSNADPGSAFAKSYAKAMAMVEKKLMSSDALLGKEFFSEADLSKVSKYLNDVAEKMAEMRILAQNTPTMTLGFETDELIEATKALAELQARIRETKNAKIGTIAGMNDKPAIKRMLETAEHSNFSTGKSFDENQAAMGKSIGKLSQQVRTYELEAERAKAASEEAEEAAQSAKTALAEAAEVLKAREAVNKKVASQVGAIDTKVSRKNNVTKTSIVQQYKDLISQQVVNGSWVDGGEDFARIIAGWLQVPQDALIGPAEDVVRNLHKAIGTAMRGSDISTNVLKRNAKSVLDGESAALQQDASYREAENNVQIADAASQAASREAEDAQGVLTNANNNLTQTQELLNKIVAQMEELRELQKEYNQLVNANNANDVNNARGRKTQADKNARNQHMPYVDEGVQGLGNYSRDVTNALSRQVQERVEQQARQNAADQARREAEQFKQNLQHTINQWMSAQQVINLVKDGIRQAYQDIQGLDAAMTNIAVVTDMSVSDLWGKINEYMSIAKQYGVTTQGVYEVSQLYYQQGLSTNEVIAATTETLKMARIAGMDYAKAANAMTVAIRAFKMDMSDAGHVTDVYSKVAAVTASDTEELATAMSKTASSAESVGSSFENTTAMLAVMVETTRESAQNLGSALKSIISRYGEMKQGLTQDSDGEIIDYNKTDAALRSIGISIKDAQGQFRDFDDVIFELSSKWDSLDKNTQRYIATIMAGNRQQSRFIALVDNWERLDEVTTAAQDSEDAGLLQYAKTLDSLDTKINNLKTSFQQFYMSIFDGEFFKGFIEIVTNAVDNLSKMGPLLGGINLLQLINQIKLVGQLLLSAFSKGITKIQGSSQEWQKAFTNGWPTVGERIGDVIAKALVAKAKEAGMQFANEVEAGAKQQTDDKTNSDIPQAAQTAKAVPKLNIISQKLVDRKLNAMLPETQAQVGEIKWNTRGQRNRTWSDTSTMVEQYSAAANKILENQDRYSEAAINWANTVKTSCEKFQSTSKSAGNEIKRGAVEAARKELSAADEEARIELSAAQKAKETAAKQFLRNNGGQIAMAAGTLLSTYGMTIDQSTMAGYDASTGLQIGGSALSALGQVATGNYIGAAISAVTGIITAIERITNRAKYELENAKKAAEEANVERAQKKDKWQSLETYAKKLKEAEKARYDSNEAEQEWLNLNNEIAEKYPELISYIDAEGNSIVNLTEDYEGLSRAKREYLEQEAEYWDKKVEEARLERDILSDTHIGDFRTSGGGLEGVDNATLSVVGWARNNHQLQSTISSQLAFYDKNQGNITDADYLDSFFSEEGFYGKNLEDLITILGLTYDEVNKVFGRKGFRFSNWTVQQAKDNGFSKVTSQEDLAKFYRAAAEEGLITGDRKTALLRNSGVATYHSDYLQAASDLALDRNFTSLGEINQWLAQFSGKDGLDNLLTAGVDLSYLFTLANNKDNILGSSLAQQILTHTGLGTQNEDGYWIVDEDSQEKWDELVKYQQNEELYNSYLRSSISSHGNLLLHDTETADMLSGMSGYEQILLQRAETYAVNGKTLLDVRDSAETMQAIYGEYATEIGEWFMNLPPAVREEFNQFMANQKDYTLDELETFLKTKLNLEESDPLYQDLVSNWWTATNTAKYRAAKVIWKPTDADITDAGKLTKEKFKELRKKNAPASALGKYIGSDEEAYNKYLEDTEADDLRMLSFDNWKTNADLLEWAKKEVQDGDSSRYVTDEEAYNYYVDSVLTKWQEYGLITEEEATLLKERSAVELEQLSTFMSIREDMHSKASFHRKGKISEQTEELRNTWNKLLNGDNTNIFGIDTSQLSTEAKGELASLLVAENVGTIEWLKSVGEYAAKYELNVEEVKKAAAEYVQSSFSTEVALLVDATDEFKTTLEDFAKKQQSGYTFEEAKQLMNQLKATGEKYDFTDVFEVNEQGLLVLKNFDQTYEDLYNSTLDRYTQFSNALGFLPKVPEGVEGEELEELLKTTLGMLVAYSTDVAGYLKTLSTEDVNSEAYQKAQTGLTQAYDNIKEFLKTNLKIEDEVLLDSIVKDLEAHQYTTATEIYNYLQSKAEELKISSDMLEAAFIQSLSQHSFIEATKKYTNALTAKNATSASTVSDLDSILKERAKITTLTIDGKEQDYSTWSLTQEGWDQYYAAELAALELHGASLDAFGNLIVNDWVAWGEYIADSYGYSEAAIQDAIENDDPDTAAKLSAARAQILQSAKTSQIELQETTLKNIQGGLENLYTSFIEDGEIEFSEVEDILTTLQPKISNDSYAELLQLYEKAKDGTAKDFETFIEQLANLARAAGYNINEDEITAKIQDAYTSLVKTLFDSLSNAINGSLTADDLGSLETSLGLDLSAYQQQTLDGYQLSSEGLLKVAGELEHRYGNVAGYAEKMAELFVGEDKLYSGREELEARIAEIEKARDSEEKVSEELEYQLSLLKKMATTSRLNKDDPLFNFMNQDSTKGFAAGADEMVASIDKVKSAFSSITAGEQILADDFYNMMDFMYNNRAKGMQNWDDSAWLASALGITPEAIQQLSNKTDEATSTYEAFVNAVVSSSGELGKVDTEVLLEMGISMDTMSSSMAGSLQTVAKQQIDFLTNMRKTLEALQALDNIEDISIGLGFTASDGTEVTLANFDKYYLEFDQSKLEAEIKDLIQTVDETFTAAGYGFDYKTLFGDNGFSLQDEADIAVAKGLGQFINFYKTATETELTNFAQQYPDIFKEDSTDWAKLKDIFATGIDWNSFASSLTADLQASVQAALANVPGIELDSLNIKWVGKTDAELANAKAAIIKAYKDQGKDIELELGKDNIFTVHIIPSNVKAIIDKDPTQWNYSFDNKNYTRDLDITTEAGTVGVQVVIDNLGNVTFTGKDGAELDEATIKEAAENAGIYSMTGLELQADGSGTANINITASESTAATVSTIAADVSKIVELLSAGITISVDSEAANETLAAIQEVYNTLKENIANNPIKISLEYDTPPELSLPPITRTVKLEYNNNSSNSSTDGESGAGSATGNFKAVAMTKAKGNVSALSIGAALAQGTLMGELGPELYVQGGQYQIAGANGPEFVDLAPDAIVFNHLQTANLLGKGHTTKTGSPITSERRAVGAYATGSVSGSAFANGSIGSAIAAINRAIAIWENIANITAADFASGGGGGGGGGENSVKAVTEELVKWYNLSRQIEKLEQDINNILAERENIVDGGEYLRSLREQQKLLAQQAATQQTLLAYQEEQLERQKQHILNNKIWSQFLTFDESGNLQYIVGNESNGGQGQLNVLEQLNKMSGEEQLDYIKNTLGYSYTDQDGNELDGEDLITKFFEELQGQIDSYDALFDTVNSTEEKLQEIQSTINEIDQEIEQNQMDLEQAIYDIIVDAWEKQIEQMEEQMELVQEANEAYIENLNKALSDERDMYSQNESIADRESLQNRLALLRRSGGSASEIYDLEQQLDDMLKDEYFNKQEKMIEHIEEANEEQIRKLEEQIKLEEEALEYQKENGVLWTQVYEIMRGTEESILAFMQGNSPEFFSQSTLQQKKMLTDWAKQIGIYTEDQQYKNYQREAEEAHWDNNSWRANISEGGVGPELAAIFDGLGADQQGTLKSLFTSTYANEMLESGDENAALTAAIEALKAQLRNIQAQQAETATGGNTGGNGTGGGTQNPSPSQSPRRYRVDYTVVFVDNQTKTGYGVGNSEAEALAAAKYWAKKHTHTKSPKDDMHPGKAPVRNTVYSKAYAYKQGGLVDYTGPALVHGTPSKPEAFLNAKQTAMISEAVKAVGDGGALNGIKATLAALNSTIKGIVNNDNSLTSSFTVAPGAVTIQVAQLNDSYDVEELSKDVMNRMVAIASRTTNRGVNRR